MIFCISMQMTQLSFHMRRKYPLRLASNLVNPWSSGRFLLECHLKAFGIILINYQKRWFGVWKIYLCLWQIQLYQLNRLHWRANAQLCPHVDIFQTHRGGHHLTVQWFRALKLICKITLEFWHQRMFLIPIGCVES